MEAKDLIIQLLENERRRGILLELYSGRKSFTELKEEADIGNNTTLSRDLEYLDRAGLIVNIFERTKSGAYSHYELNSYGRRIAEIVIEIEKDVNEKLDDLVVA
jgi:DNA-binding HxlR family transcriptional regulator